MDVNMITKEAAQYNFFKQFMSAYPTTSVPEDVVFPYLTYDPFMSGYGASESKTVSMWFYTESEAVANNGAKQLADAIGYGGIQIAYDGGTLWLKRGVPFLIASTDADVKNVKLRQFNIEISCNSIA